MSDLLMVKTCAYCNGTGIEGAGESARTCTVCGGGGEIEIGNMKILSPILSDMQTKIDALYEDLNP